jgi:hypothetical protein
LGHDERKMAAAGDIPDLDIRLDGVDLMQVIRRYGYVPAVKSRTMLLGKIVGSQFLPITPEEKARYAQRGRSGAGHPEAARWLQRIADELQIPLADMQFIFLVPSHTEEWFITAEHKALERTAKTAAETALIRAHVAGDFSLVVDELILKTGEIIPIDSLRLPSLW